MSQEREVIRLTKSTKPVTEMSDEEYEASMVEVLTRDMLSGRLTVDLPDDIHGEWAANDPVAIERKKALGFEIDTQYATKNALHRDASGNPIIGDTIHMIIPKNRYEILKKIEKRRYNEQHQIKEGKTPEERAYLEKNKGTDMPSIDNSKTEKVDLTKLD